MSSLLDELAGPTRPLSLLESAGVVGGLRWVELEAFARLGRAAVSGDLPADLAVWASGASLGHAWRAEQLLALLPVSVGLPSAEVCTAAPGPATEQFVERVQPGTALAGWYSELAAAYERRATFVHPSADLAAARVFGRLAADTRSIAFAPVPDATSRPLAGPSSAPVPPAPAGNA